MKENYVDICHVRPLKAESNSSHHDTESPVMVPENSWEEEKIQDDIREYLMSVNEYKTQQNEMKVFM